MPNMLHLSLLGKVHATMTGDEREETVLTFHTNKALALLCYLAVTQEAHPRATLAQLLWGADQEAKTRISLRVALSNLRKVLPDHLIITTETAALNLDSPYRLDVARFDACTQSLDAPDGWLDIPALEEAVALYRGDFMTDFFVDGAPAYEDWITSEREHRRQTMLDALDALANWYLDQRNYAQAEAARKRLLALEPWDEESHRQLMIIFSRMEDFNAALAQYEICRQVLAAELDVEPMPETAALRDRIVQARQGRTHNLPAETAPFIGRATELSQLSNMLGNPNCRLVTIVGLGGMGKTSLALAAARRLVHEQALTFLNGVSLVTLVDLDSADALPLSIADALDIRLTGQAHPLVELLSHLRNQEMLLVLDNFEQLMGVSNDGRATIKRILDDCPHVTLLVTSREPLDLAEEWRLDLEGLSYPGLADDVKTLSDATWDAVELFVQSAQQVHPNFVLTPANEPDVRRLVAGAIGMPLAIKLAASWLRAMSLKRIVTELERNLDIFSTRLRDVPARQRSMRVIFDYSWGLLAEKEQAAFLSLSIFRGGFTEDAAMAVVDATPALLSSLVDHWLLHLEMTATGFRYSMHELVRQYAAEKRRQRPDLHRQVLERHSAYFVEYIRARLDPMLQTLDTKDTVQSVSEEFGNISRCWRYATEKRNAADIDVLAPAIYLYALYRSWHKPAIEMLADAIRAIDNQGGNSALEIRLLAQLLARQGDCYFYLSQYPEAASCLERAVAYAHQGSDPRIIGFALSRSADVAHAQGRYQAALEFATGAQAMYEQANHTFGLAIVHRELSSIHFSLGNYKRAVHHAQTAVDQSEGRGDTLARGLHCLGLVRHNLGDFAPAVSALLESADIIRSQGLRHPIGHVWTALAWVSCSTGDLDAATSYATEALANALSIDDGATVAIAKDILGIAARLAGNSADAVELQRAALALNRTLGRLGYVAINLNHLGLAHQDLGNLDQAQTYLDECYALSQRLDHGWTQARVLDSLCQLALRRNDSAAAQAYNDASLALARKMESPPLLIACLVNRTALLLVRSKRDEAAHLLAFVLAQPTTRYETVLRARALWDDTMAGLGEDAAASIRTAAQTAVLTDLVDAVDD